MNIDTINGLYTFTVKNSAVISGEFTNMKLVQIVGYDDAILKDSKLPELMRVLNFLTPEDETYYIFTKDNKEYVIARVWINLTSIIVGNSLSTMVLTINSLTLPDRSLILNMLDSYSYDYTVA